MGCDRMCEGVYPDSVTSTDTFVFSATWDSDQIGMFTVVKTLRSDPTMTKKLKYTLFLHET